MKSICIKNLRSLAGFEEVEIKPITLFVGQNNSGKSTFLRSLPLLRQSAESLTNGPLLWYGKYVDFGNFISSMNHSPISDQMVFKFNIGKVPMTNGVGFPVTRMFDLEKDLSIEVNISPYKDDAFVHLINIEFEDFLIQLNLGENHEINDLIVNGSSFTSTIDKYSWTLSNGLIPVIVEKKGRKDYLDRFPFHGWNLIAGKIQQLKLDREREFNLFYYIAQITIGSSGKIIEQLKSLNEKSKNIKLILQKEEISDQDYEEFSKLLIADNSLKILNKCRDYLFKFSCNVKYIGPYRTSDRYYRHQNLSIDEVDFQGHNLAINLINLRDNNLQKRFDSWTKKNFGFITVLEDYQGYSSIFIKRRKHQFNLADVGFGYTQMLPIITQVWQTANSKHNEDKNITYNPVTIAIEQPELHLHPQLQSDLTKALADLLIISQRNGVDLRLIIETHSPDVINELGSLIYNKKLKPELLGVYIFTKDKNEITSRITKSHYNGDGFLMNWPDGFFEPDPE